MKLEPRVSTTTVAFIGDDVHRVLSDHVDLTHAVRKLGLKATDATIECHVSPRMHETDDFPVQWFVRISSPAGQRSLVAIQRSPTAKVTFHTP